MTSADCLPKSGEWKLVNKSEVMKIKEDGRCEGIGIDRRRLQAVPLIFPEFCQPLFTFHYSPTRYHQRHTRAALARLQNRKTQWRKCRRTCRWTDTRRDAPTTDDDKY